MYDAEQLLRTVVVAAFCAIAASPGQAAQVKVAVAANFTEPSKQIAGLFEKVTGHKLVLSYGATGQLYAQITQGAPFEVLMAADKATPTKAVVDGHAVKGTQLTYALGKLVLYSTMAGLVTGAETLSQGKFTKLAIANPAAAPYGAAAVETMKALGIYDILAPKIVQGQNIAQAFQFIETGNAEIGFVALAQIAIAKSGSRWVVPPTLHVPILQDAVLLKPGEKSDAARAFLAFLKGKEARVVIENFGYGLSE